ncbi:hypothetical protein HDU93_007475 [Gonapodya sp. JEL0774]|nr:hypothetical protein HDU93_007475 [Gonapodya sp. JEL0774]
MVLRLPAIQIFRAATCSAAPLPRRVFHWTPTLLQPFHNTDSQPFGESLVPPEVEETVAKELEQGSLAYSVFKLRTALAESHQMLKSKDEVLKSKDEIVKSKDETLKSILKSNDYIIEAKNEVLEAKNKIIEGMDRELKRTNTDLLRARHSVDLRGVMERFEEKVLETYRGTRTTKWTAYIAANESSKLRGELNLPPKKVLELSKDLYSLLSSDIHNSLSTSPKYVVWNVSRFDLSTNRLILYMLRETNVFFKAENAEGSMDELGLKPTECYP